MQHIQMEHGTQPGQTSEAKQSSNVAILTLAALAAGWRLGGRGDRLSCRAG